MASKDMRYSEEQIIRILKEVEAGTSVAEVCRKYGVSGKPCIAGGVNMVAWTPASCNACGH